MELRTHRAARTLAAALAALVLASLTARTGRAEVIRIEAESYTASENTGYPILPVDCPDASGGYAVTGVDELGDWIELRLDLPHGFSFAESLRSAGDSGFVRVFDLEFRSDFDQELLFTDHLVTPPGSGIT